MSIWGRAVAARPVARNKIEPRPAVQPPPAPEPPPEPSKKADHTSVYHTPEAWPRKFGEAKPAPVEVSPNPPGRPRMRTDQRRRNTISIALSEEEERYVRDAAAGKGISISEWARIAFFRAMGRKVPQRDMKRRDWAKGPENSPDDE